MNPAVQLTKREEQIVTGIVMGYCKKEIADRLSISVRTAEAETRNAMIKAEVKKSTDLVVLWFVQRFSIPVELLPKSITAFVFLILFCGYEFIAGGEALRSTRTRTKTEGVRTRTSRRHDYILEF